MVRIFNFNSIKVQLERNSTSSNIRTFKNFNSIKVQLELNFPDFSSLLFSKFQFHKGTIRTHKICNDHYLYRQISIP